MNDMVTVSSITNLIMFADDTNLFFSGNDIDPLAKLVNLELEKITDWFKANKLFLNIKKTHFILFRTKNKKIVSIVSIKINKIAINQETLTKFLCIIINQSLSWNDHISIVKQKVSKGIGIIKHIRKNLPQSVLLTLYFSLVHPYFEYCNIVLGICRSAVFNSLFLLQKKQFVLLLIPNGILIFILLLCFTNYIFCLCTS